MNIIHKFVRKWPPIPFGIVFALLCLFPLFFSCSGDSFNETIRSETGNGDSPVPGSSGFVTAAFTSHTAISVSWQKASDDVTESVSLQYIVFASEKSFGNYDDAAANADELTSGWTEDISSIAAGTASEEYAWCNIYVRDEDGMISPYSGTVPVLFNDNAPAAGNNGILHAAADSSGAKIIYWEKASDDVTAQTDLQYRVFKASSPFSDISEASSEITYGWTVDIEALAMPDSISDSYYNVFVRDEEAHVSAYASCLISSSTTAPVPGGGLKAVSPISTNKIGLQWTAASGSAIIEYIVYYSTQQSDVATWEAASSSGTAFGTWQSGTSVTVTGLSKSTAYYFNVFVRDDSRIVAEYGEISQATN
ncbi:MAG: fibronectin type III domain-containing protein [Spirochaetota bacterium]